jgi:hypothetical protein
MEQLFEVKKNVDRISEISGILIDRSNYNWDGLKSIKSIKDLRFFSHEISDIIGIDVVVSEIVDGIKNSFGVSFSQNFLELHIRETLGWPRPPPGDSTSRFQILQSEDGSRILLFLLEILSPPGKERSATIKSAMFKLM